MKGSNGWKITLIHGKIVIHSYTLIIGGILHCFIWIKIVTTKVEFQFQFLIFFFEDEIQVRNEKFHHIVIEFLIHHFKPKLVFDLYKHHIWNVNKGYSQDQLNAISFLWRLDLRNIPVSSDYWEELGEYASFRTRQHLQPFYDMHYIYALARSNQTERVDNQIFLSIFFG
jgi:hypothetical protein